MGGGTHDGVGGTQSFGEESIQPQPRIKQSLLLSRFYRTAPESALSEMFVFDHALIAWTMNGTFYGVMDKKGDVSVKGGASSCSRCANSSAVRAESRFCGDST
jgi:hypothetical protein